MTTTFFATPIVASRMGTAVIDGNSTIQAIGFFPTFFGGILVSKPSLE